MAKRAAKPAPALIDAADRRGEILDATLALIASAGIDAVRYREVAVRAGVPLGTVSYHFTQRPQLLAAAFRHFFSRNSEVLREVGQRFPRRRLQDVAQFLRELIRIDFADPNRTMLAEYELILYAARDPELASALALWDHAMSTELGAVLESFSVAQPHATARTLMEMVRGFQLVNLGRTLLELNPALADFEQRVLSVLTKRKSP